MAYESVDALQRALAQQVFAYAADEKKAAGRALGTLVELITFYLIKSWGLERNVAIERRLPEYANPEITHNVEFSLHPSEGIGFCTFDHGDLPLTSSKILRSLGIGGSSNDIIKSHQLLSRDSVLRNACTLLERQDQFIVAYLDENTSGTYGVTANCLDVHPFAVLECKRVGVEEGVKKGPQTIEKAKQGAYVARSLSSIQRVRMNDGAMYGVWDSGSGTLQFAPYNDFVQTVIDSDRADILADFTLTVGIVSNHGNWFSSNDQNKELKVLANSYDWLLFLTDEGLSQFVERVLLAPSKAYQAAQEAFMQSYSGKRGGNVFTKVRISLNADAAILQFFENYAGDIEDWFNVVSPVGRSLSDLRYDLERLSSKKWGTLA